MPPDMTSAIANTKGKASLSDFLILLFLLPFVLHFVLEDLPFTLPFPYYSIGCASVDLGSVKAILAENTKMRCYFIGRSILRKSFVRISL